MERDVKYWKRCSFFLSQYFTILSKSISWRKWNGLKLKYLRWSSWCLRSHRDLSAQPRPESSDPTYAFWTWGVDVSRLKSESMVVHWLPVKFTGRRMGWTCSWVNTDPDLEELHLGELQSWFYFVLHLQQQQQVLGEAIEYFFLVPWLLTTWATWPLNPWKSLVNAAVMDAWCEKEEGRLLISSWWRSTERTSDFLSALTS